MGQFNSGELNYFDHRDVQCQTQCTRLKNFILFYFWIGFEEFWMSNNISGVIKGRHRNVKIVQEHDGERRMASIDGCLWF